MLALYGCTKAAALASASTLLLRECRGVLRGLPAASAKLFPRGVATCAPPKSMLLALPCLEGVGGPVMCIRLITNLLIK